MQHRFASATRVIAATHPKLEFSGYAHLSKGEGEARFDRLIDAESDFRWDNPGASTRFRTDAQFLAAQLFYNGKHTRMDAINGNGVFLVDGKVVGAYQAGTRRGAISGAVPMPADGAPHLVEIVLPYGDAVDFRGLEVDAEARLYSVAPRERPRWIAYGDSITQGFRASDVTHSYPFQVGEQNDWKGINMGFGGRQLTPADGKIVASLRPGIISVLMGANDGLGNKTPNQFRRDMELFLDHVRAVEETVPICLVTPLTVVEGWNDLETELELYRAQMRLLVAERADKNLKLIEGPALIPAKSEYFQDGLHPNDAGFLLMSRRLAPQLKTPGL